MCGWATVVLMLIGVRWLRNRSSAHMKLSRWASMEYEERAFREYIILSRGIAWSWRLLCYHVRRRRQKVIGQI
jgi:hypothetical protein